MKKLQQISGQIAFWLSWPLLLVYLRIGSRTRVVVVHGSDVLVVHNWHGDGKWSFPGGGLKRREDPKHGAAREVLEETGVLVQPENLQTLIKGISKQRGLTYKYECFWTQVSTKDSLHSRPLEIVDVTWLPIDQLTSDNASKDTLLFLATWQQRR